MQYFYFFDLLEKSRGQQNRCLFRVEAFISGIWEWSAAANLLELVAKNTSGSARWSTMGCVTVFARGLRGKAGVSWLATIALDELHRIAQSSGKTLSAQSTGKTLSAGALFRTWAVTIKKAFWQECTSRGDDMWPAHREGRHAAFSGKHFVRAMEDEVGLQAAADAADRLAGRSGLENWALLHAPPLTGSDTPPPPPRV